MRVLKLGKSTLIKRKEKEMVELIFVPLALISLAVNFKILFSGKKEWRWFCYLALSFISAGWLMNIITFYANGGMMPVYLPAAEKVGIKPDDKIKGHFFVRENEKEKVKLFAFSDRYPSPYPFKKNVKSIGDFLIDAGFALIITILLLNEKLFLATLFLLAWIVV
jgi:hypothetical protein